MQIRIAENALQTAVGERRRKEKKAVVFFGFLFVKKPLLFELFPHHQETHLSRSQRVICPLAHLELLWLGDSGDDTPKKKIKNQNPASINFQKNFKKFMYGLHIAPLKFFNILRKFFKLYVFYTEKIARKIILDTHFAHSSSQCSMCTLGVHLYKPPPLFFFFRFWTTCD